MEQPKRCGRGMRGYQNPREYVIRALCRRGRGAIAIRGNDARWKKNGSLSKVSRILPAQDVGVRMRMYIYIILNKMFLAIGIPPAEPLDISEF